eukprot:Nitzschia sp. Nitz4//scaffold87_size112219//13569//14339//NITZ4_004061-RA/size112219-processed-gene-0.16-mRNA-1//-1//CDS//3329559330//9196//frame0
MPRQDLDFEQELEALAVLEQADMDMLLETPTTTTLNQSTPLTFESRLEKRKDLYRGLLKGESSPVSQSHQWRSTSPSLSGSNHSNSDSSPRRREYQRSSSDTAAFQARNLRAQRLRNAKKMSSDEADVAESLRRRRLAELEQVRLERLREEEFPADERDYPEEEDDVESSRESRRSSRRSRSKRMVRRSSRRHRSSISEETDFAFVDSIEALLRRSGLLKTCVTGCFGIGDEEMERIRKIDDALADLSSSDVSEES